MNSVPQGADLKLDGIEVGMTPKVLLNSLFFVQLLVLLCCTMELVIGVDDPQADDVPRLVGDPFGVRSQSHAGGVLVRVGRGAARGTRSHLRQWRWGSRR